MPKTHRAAVIDGKLLAERVRADLAERVEKHRRSGRTVRLDSVLVAGDEAAAIYAHRQSQSCREVGIEHVLHRLPANA